jgi:phospholipase/lecithinase/hemolysin
MQFRTLFAYAVALAIVGIGDAAAEPFSAVYAFGDSLSDAGNVFLATGGAIPAPPYFNGHFSNGPTWVENLSQDLGLGPLLPSLAGGNDYAFGGATTGALGPTLIAGVPTPIPNITQQVAAFTSVVAGHAVSTGLYTVWIGANDLFQAIGEIAGGVLTLAGAQADLTTAAQVATAAVGALASEGAKTFIIPLEPDVGETPALNHTPFKAEARALTTFYNASLVADLDSLIGSAGIAVDFLDVFSLFDDAVANPALFGLSNITDPCYPGPFTGGVPACSNPNSFLFWDTEHPTETGHERVAELAVNAVPEPPTIMMLIMMLGMSWVFSRRARTWIHGERQS